ncbi:MAG TPA: HAMP domain-containing sensor histidine kinase [Actinomycetota bacterium]|nr:HAMP domain-containing sensor histidine kinase [Actinomycetota bacterium]
MTAIRRSSLAGRLLAIYFLVVAAALMLVAALVVYLTRQQLVRELDRNIARTVDLFETGPGSRVALAEDLDPAARDWLASTALPAELSVLVRLPSSRVLASTGAADLTAAAEGRQLVASSTPRSDRFPLAGTDFRAQAVPIVLDGQPLGTLVVAASERNVENSVSGILRGVAVACGAGILVAALLGYLSVRRALGPLQRFAGRVQEIERTGDLSHRLADGSTDEVGRLAQAFDQLLGRLESSFENQKRFVADASHELRTPLTIARGQLELLRNEMQSEADRRSAGIAIEELDRMGRIVEDLLLLARLDEGLQLERRPVEVELVMQEALLRGMLIDRREARVNVEPGLFVFADPERLLQVLSNLVTNAIRHGGPHAELMLSARRDGDGVLLEVSDTGPGIPPEDVEQIFDRLFRGSRPSAGAAAGAGLGLAIARSLTEAMGGRIWASSTPGVGTTISVRLRAAGAPGPAAAGAAEAARPAVSGRERR